VRMSNSHVPGTADDLAAACVFVVPGLGRLDQPGGHALAQAATLVRAAIVQREEFAVEIEDDNRAPVHIDQLALPKAGCQRPRQRRAAPSRHDPEKWVPVFGQRGRLERGGRLVRDQYKLSDQADTALA
jgi:hypothetical protein